MLNQAANFQSDEPYPTAGHGAAVCVVGISDQPVVNITGGHFEGNVSARGGAIYLRACQAQIKDAEVVNNTAVNVSGGSTPISAGQGGGISAVECTNSTFENIRVEGNTAESAGGGLFFGDSKLTIKGTSSICTTSTYGGGVLLSGDYANTVVTGQATIKQNNAVQFKKENAVDCLFAGAADARPKLYLDPTSSEVSGIIGLYSVNADYMPYVGLLTPVPEGKQYTVDFIVPAQAVEQTVVVAPETYEVDGKVLTLDDAEPYAANFKNPQYVVVPGSTYGADLTGKLVLGGKAYSLILDANGGTGGPGTITGLPAGTHALPMEPAPSHAQVDGKDVAFIGWTAAPDNKIYAGSDTAPTTLTEVSIVDQNVTVYAVYGFDDNGNGIPDVVEATVTFNAKRDHRLCNLHIQLSKRKLWWWRRNDLLYH